MPSTPPPSTSHAELTRQRKSAAAPLSAMAAVTPSTIAVCASWAVTKGHQSDRGDSHAVEEGACHRRAAQAWHQRCSDRDEDERGQEDPERGRRRAGQAAQHVADERGRGEERPGRELADGNRVEKLALGESARAVHRSSGVAWPRRSGPGERRRRRSPRVRGRRGGRVPARRRRPRSARATAWRWGGGPESLDDDGHDDWAAGPPKPRAPSFRKTRAIATSGRVGVV
jgi:hypothetical protein